MTGIREKRVGERAGIVAIIRGHVYRHSAIFIQDLKVIRQGRWIIVNVSDHKGNGAVGALTNNIAGGVNECGSSVEIGIGRETVGASG